MCGGSIYDVRRGIITVLSKGLLLKKYSNSRIVIQNQGGRYELKGKKAYIWLLARSGFTSRGIEEQRIFSELCKEGVLGQTDMPNSYGMYCLLTSNILCVNRRKGLRFPLRGLEKKIMQWLQDGKRKLTVEELIFLIENDVNPLIYEDDMFGVALSERIYQTRVHVNNALRREMVGAKYRDITVNAILRLLEKNRLYLM